VAATLAGEWVERGHERYAATGIFGYRIVFMLILE